MKIAKRLLALVLTVATLLSCTGCAYIFDGVFSLLGGNTEPTQSSDPCEGHYLVDLYEPYNATRNKHAPDRFSSYVTLQDEITMAGESFQKGIRFEGAPWDGDDLYFDYDIGGKYENISFFYGMDMATRWQATNVAFQVINPDTNEIIWEDLLVTGDIPRFVTVNIAGLERIRLECYVKGGGYYCMANISLWEGESQATDRSYPKITEPTMLEDNYKFYYTKGTFTLATSYPIRNFGESSTKLSIKGEKFEHAALVDFGDGDNDDLYINLRGQFKQISFYWGIADNQPNSVYDGFKGWVSIYADGKCVLDEYVCTTETPANTIVLDVDYAWQLRIVTRSNTWHNARYCLAKLQGGENLGTQTESNKYLYDPVPMIRTYPPYFLSESTLARAKVLDSSSRYEFFSMGGNKYIEGIVLQPVWNLWSDDYPDPAYAITDLEGEQKYLSFTMGHVDTSPYKDAVVHIYLDDEDEPSYVYNIKSTDLPQDYVIDIHNCRTIKFLCISETASNLPTIGIANIVAYPDEVVENDIFPPYYTEYPAECELLDYFLPFGYYSAFIDHPYYTDGVEDDGMYFETCDGVKHKKGLLFCTNVGIDWDYFGFIGLVACFIGPGATGAAMSGSLISCKNSFYVFNLDGQYDTLTFKTAKVSEISTQSLPTYKHAADPEWVSMLQDINVYGDDGSTPLYSCRLNDGEVQEHTIDVSGVKRLVICVPNNDHLVSEVYSAFDIFLSKNED